MLDIKILKLNEDVRLPEKQTPGSAAYDLYTPGPCIVPPGRSVVKLGFSIAMPYGVQAMIEPRSGYSCKGFEAYIIPPENLIKLIGPKGLTYEESAVEYVLQDNTKVHRWDADVINGKVDSDFRGEVGVIINNRTNYNLLLGKHQRIAQMTFSFVQDANFIHVTELDETERGKGGYGHTGSK